MGCFFGRGVEDCVVVDVSNDVVVEIDGVGYVGKFETRGEMAECFYENFHGAMPRGSTGSTTLSGASKAQS